jgi:hypothetical protein
MTESKPVQKDLLGNPIESKIPRTFTPFAEGQTTLDSFMEKINNPGVEISVVKNESSIGRRGLKRKPEFLIINKDTRDEISLTGFYYTPMVGKDVWTAPSERRDSYPKVKTEEGGIIFQVKGGDIWENGIRWAEVVVLQRVKPGEASQIKGHGYMRWVDIQKK